MNNINKHIEKYLNYYLDSNFNPGFAVLLQGKWGCGKTWFIKQFIEQNSDRIKPRKFIYISLYGISSISEIEDQIFQQLHPILSSKTMALAGKILKGFARASLKINLDDDDKCEGSFNAQLPDFKIPDYLKNTSESILIFDDLERCAISLTQLLGYINSFIEHQELKVIIIANEEELRCIEKNNNQEKKLYGKIKEKLIGKTFQVEHDFNQAFSDFVYRIKQKETQQFLTQNKDKILNIFNTANYHNLRHLKQCMWDFERFLQSIPKKYRKNTDMMTDLLLHFFIFSFEIKSSKITPSDIKDLDFFSFLDLNTNGDGQNKDAPRPINKILIKYSLTSANDMILTEKSWRDLLGKGYLDEHTLYESLSNSKYCQNDNTPSWVKLWHYLDLNDDEFTSLYSEVLTQWNEKQFTSLGEVLHICGLFLQFSYIGIIDRKPDEVLSDCKKYIDNLKKDNNLREYYDENKKFTFFAVGQSEGLAYNGAKLIEFQKVIDYLKKKIDEAKIESLPDAGQKLLEILESDTNEFSRMIYQSDTQDSIYRNTPIFKYLDPNEFIKSFLKLSNSNKHTAIWALVERYKYENRIQELSEEIDFLNEIDKLLTKEANKKKGTLSGYLLDDIVNTKIKKIINKIEKTNKTN